MECTLLGIEGLKEIAVADKFIFILFIEFWGVAWLHLGVLAFLVDGNLNLRNSGSIFKDNMKIIEGGANSKFCINEQLSEQSLIYWL